jgi:drug/metabolite transporter (DMT)-like permease
VLVRLSDLGPFASGFWRLGFSVPVLGLIALLSAPTARKGGGPFSARDHALAAAAGVSFAADIACWHSALFYTSVTDATLIANLAPVFVAITSAIFFNERFGGRFAFGFALALAGAAALVMQKAGGAPPLDRFFGDILSLGAAATYAIYMMLVGQLRRRHSAQTVVFYTTLVSGLILLPVALASGQSLIPGSLYGLMILLAIALVAHVGGQGLLTYALGHLPASFSGMTQFLQTVVAALAAWALLAEPLSWGKAAAGAAILVGIVICRLASSREAA